jgi:hypothetical protein
MCVSVGECRERVRQPSQGVGFGQMWPVPSRGTGQTQTVQAQMWPVLRRCGSEGRTDRAVVVHASLKNLESVVRRDQAVRYGYLRASRVISRNNTCMLDAACHVYVGRRMPRVCWTPQCHVYVGRRNATCMLDAA